jgi:site-specific recombinase XerD
MTYHTEGRKNVLVEAGSGGGATHGDPGTIHSQVEAFGSWCVKRKHLAQTTVKARTFVLGRVEALLPNGVMLDSATTHHLELALEGCSLSASSRSDYISHLRQYFKYLQIEGVRADSPAFALIAPKKPAGKPRPISEKDLDRAIRQAGNRQPIRAFLLLASYGGLRCVEIARMRFEDFDEHEERLTVRGKGGKERVIPLHPLLVRELRTHKVLDQGPFFITYQNTQYSARSVSTLINVHLLKCGINSTAHKLRHRFGTKIYETTKDIYVASELLGHSSLDVTKTYVAMEVDALRDAVKALR